MRFGKKITAKLLLGFTSILVLVLVLSYGSLTAVDRLGASLDNAVHSGARKLQLLGEIRTGFEEMRTGAGKVEMSSVNMLVGKLETPGADAGPSCSGCHTRDDVGEQKRQFDAAGVRLQMKIQELRPLVTAENERRALDTIETGVTSWRSLYEEYLNLTWKYRFSDAHDIMLQKIYPLIGNLAQVTDQLQGRQQELLKEAGLAAQTQVAQSRTAAFVLIGLCFAVGGGLYGTIRGVNRQLRQFAAEMTDVTEQVAAGASQVSASSQALAEGASRQASALQDTSSSSEEINSTARSSAGKSGSAAEKMAEAARRVDQANRTLQQMMISMSAIDASSGKISKIIKVIDEVAFQTNILALNASVEAARAGEAGMGFAVVAEEVRNLAQQCVQAAGETTSLIEESMAMSHDGKSKFDEVARVIQSITASSEQAKTLVDAVSLSSQEQMRGVERVTQAIARMGAETRTTAAGAEESAAAAEGLATQSNVLKDIVDRIAALV